MENNNNNNSEEEIKKYFDQKKFNTIIVGKEGVQKKTDGSELFDALADDRLTREERDEALIQLKELNKPEQLVEAIDSEKSPVKKARLTSAAWESELDMAKHFSFFVDLACSPDFSVAMEAITVIENIESPVAEADINSAKKQVEEKIAEDPPTGALLSDFLEKLNKLG